MIEEFTTPSRIQRKQLSPPKKDFNCVIQCCNVSNKRKVPPLSVKSKIGAASDLHNRKGDMSVKPLQDLSNSQIGYHRQCYQTFTDSSKLLK